VSAIKEAHVKQPKQAARQMGRKPVTREATEAAREVDGADGGGRLVFQKPMEGWVGACAVPIQFPTRPLGAIIVCLHF